jgi:ribosome biogenesis GTPase
MVRKGKSQRRIKDWKRRLREQPDPAVLDARESETLLPERVKLARSRFQQPDQPDPGDRPRGQGLVTGLFPGGASVLVEKRHLLCALAGTFRPPAGSSALAVGDEVTVVLAPPAPGGESLQEDKLRADGFILSRQPRRTALSRPQPLSGKHRGRYDKEVAEKVIAANMEVLLIVVSVRQPPVRPGLIDRFCIAAERGDLRAEVVVNKIDLARPEAELLEQLRQGQLPFHCCSALTGEGIAELLASLVGRRSVLAGPSGVGKSALVNALLPGANLPTGPVRQKDQRGRHVTAAAVVVELPGGGVIVDTPGVRELGLEMAATELPWYFPEMAALAGQCRFNNCTHTHEPDCAVIRAAGSGAISPRRYQSYLKILQTI